VKKSTQADITNSTKVDPNVTPIKAVQVDVKKLTENNIRKIVNFDIDCSILSAKTNTITPTLSLDEEFDGSESNERIPPAVEKMIMESVNRRRLQCLICQRHFRRTHLVQQHVANVHLQLHRFQCRICGFGAWKREHVVNHTKTAHRRSHYDLINEQTLEQYFARFLAPCPEEKVEAQLSEIGDKDETDWSTANNVNSSRLLCKKLRSTSKPTLVDGTQQKLCKPVNGGADIDNPQSNVHVSMLEGIKSQIRDSREDSNSDDEVYLRKRKRIDSDLYRTSPTPKLLKESVG